MPLPRRSRPFGDLEATVMDLLWSAGRPLLVREVVDLMRPEREPAYTTVMTVMDNLHRKQWLDRTRDGRAWRYEPVLTREDYTARLMHEALVGQRRPRRRAGALRRGDRPGGRCGVGGGPAGGGRAGRARERAVTVGGALILYATAVGLAGAAGFRRAVWPLRAPRLGAAVVLAAAWSVPVAFVLAGVTIILPPSALFTDLGQLAGACLDRLRAAYGTPAGAGIVTAGQVLSLALLARLLWAVTTVARRRRTQRRRHRLLLRLAGGHRPDVAAVVLDCPGPAAYSVGGRRPAVVVTSGAVESAHRAAARRRPRPRARPSDPAPPPLDTRGAAGRGGDAAGAAAARRAGSGGSAAGDGRRRAGGRPPRAPGARQRAGGGDDGRRRFPDR